LNPTLLVATQPPPAATLFTGYPETIAAAENLLKSKKEINAACPGETSASFYIPGAPDYGCNSTGPDGEPSYKAWAGLHVNYPGTQLAFAMNAFATVKQINLVTLGIGSNDVLLLIRNCSSDPDPQGCVVTHLPDTLQAYAMNLGYILTSIRTTAGYKGKLILVGYYSPSADLIPVAQALNATMQAVGAQFGTIYADGFTAFQTAAAPFAGNVCNAGLLIHLDSTTCDIHPSPKGRDLLAATVMAVMGDK
jgi:lysophospholipase L1-like esterase